MREHTAVRIKGSLWQAIALRANRENLSPEDWLQRQLAQQEPQVSPGAAEEDLLLDLAVRHFRGLELTAAEARRLAAAIAQTAATGELIRVGPVGPAARRYEFERHAAALSIRVGEGRIRLPVQAAVRLADALRTTGELPKDIAA